MVAAPEIRVPNFRIVLAEQDIQEILDVLGTSLRQSRWVLGPATAAFEGAFARYVGAKHALAIANGGSALVAILRGLDLPENSAVVCPTLTAPPTAHAILEAGMRIVWVDADPDSLGIGVSELERTLSEHSKRVSAVIAVHIGGWISPQIEALRSLCESRGVVLIEDCAHAHGSTLNGRPAGRSGVAAAYSFFMTKPLTSGEGGAVVTDSRELAEAVSVIRNYGKDSHGIHVRRGFNHRISEFNAAVALWATRNAARLIGERRRLARRYDELLAGADQIDIVQVPHCEASYYKYIVRLASPHDRDRVRNDLLHEHGIEPVGGVYDRLCHEEPYFRSLGTDVLNEIGRAHV